MTKDERSDLESLINRVIDTELQEQSVKYAKIQARNNLDNYLHTLCNPRASTEKKEVQYA